MSSAAKNEHRLPVFGVSLDAIMSRSTQKQIPTFVKELILCLKNPADKFNLIFVILAATNYSIDLSVEGIFVNMPQPDLVYEAKKLVDYYEKDDYDFEKFDPHVVAALLKMYFRELPDPLFTSRLYMQFINSDGSISVLRDLVHKELPPHHAKLAEVLCLFLRLVLDYSAINKLSVDELAVMFGPLLIRTQTETIDTMADTKKRTRVFKQLIQNADKIFPKIPAKRTLVRVQETPEIIGQKQKLVTIKGSLKASVQALSKQLVTIHTDLDAASNMEELLEITRTLKALKENFINYTKNKTAAQEEKQPLSARRYLPGSICKSAVEAGHTSLQGKRASMEDRITMFDDLNETSDMLSKNVNRALYAVYDGHSGSDAAEIASQRLYRDIVTQEAFENGDILEAVKLGVEKTDLFILDNVPEAGSTMVMTILIGEELYVANLGDSEAVLAKRSDAHASNYEALCITHKHKPDNPDEKDRITAAGAMVFRHRIYGKLAVARALGDAEYKMPKVKADYVSRDPYLQRIHLTDEHDFLVMACDGLWDKMTHQEAVDFVAERMTGGHSAQEISSLLANKALDLGSMDNVTVIVVFLKWKAPTP